MSEHDPSLDPGQEQRLRALLADLGSGAARETDRLPPEVAIRLEDTLAGLVAEREAGEDLRASTPPPARSSRCGRAGCPASPRPPRR